MEKLVKLAQKGDKAAFVELIEAQKLSMSRTAMAILHQEADAADAVADTVLTAFSKLCDLREPRYFKTWLTRILISNCTAIYNRRRRAVSLEELEESGWDAPAGQNEFTQRENIIDIRRTLSGLAENDRLVLTLFYLDDLSVKEISKLLGVKEETVRTRLMRARKRFGAEYGGQEGKCCAK